MPTTSSRSSSSSAPTSPDRSDRLRLESARANCRCRECERRRHPPPPRRRVRAVTWRRGADGAVGRGRPAHRVEPAARALGVNGFGVVVCGTVAAAIASIDESAPDLVLLDLGLPDGDGTRSCEHIVARRRPDVPVIVVTARARRGRHRRSASRRAPSTTSSSRSGSPSCWPGCRPICASRDAFVTRRGRWSATGSPSATSRSTSPRGGCTSAIGRSRCGRRSSTSSPCSPATPGAVVTREQLIDEVWDEHWWGSTKTLDVHINAIRRKLGEQRGDARRGSRPIRSVGYRLERASAVTQTGAHRAVVGGDARGRSRSSCRLRCDASRPAQRRAARTAARGVDRRHTARGRSIDGDRLRGPRRGRRHPTTDLALYDEDGSLVDGRRSAATPTRSPPRGLAGEFAEGAVGSDLVAAVPVRVAATGTRFVRADRGAGSREPAPVPAARSCCSASPAIGVIAVAGLVGLLLARRLSRPVEELTAWAGGSVGRTAAAGRDGHRRARRAAHGADRRPDARSASCCGASDRSRRTCPTSCARRWRRCASPSRPSSTHLATTRGACCGRASVALDRLESTITSLLALARHTDREPDESDVLHGRRRRESRNGSSAHAAGRPVRASSGRRFDARRRRLLLVTSRRAARQRAHPRARQRHRRRSTREDRIEVDVADEGRPPDDRDPFSEQRTDTGHGIGLRLARTARRIGAAARLDDGARPATDVSPVAAGATSPTVAAARPLATSAVTLTASTVGLPSAHPAALIMRVRDPRRMTLTGRRRCASSTAGPTRSSPSAPRSFALTLVALATVMLTSLVPTSGTGTAAPMTRSRSPRPIRRSRPSPGRPCKLDLSRREPDGADGGRPRRRRGARRLEVDAARRRLRDPLGHGQAATHRRQGHAGDRRRRRRHGRRVPDHDHGERRRGDAVGRRRDDRRRRAGRQRDQRHRRLPVAEAATRRRRSPTT